MSDWIYIDEIDHFPDVPFAHCDTRDFCLRLVTDVEYARQGAELDPIKKCNIPDKILEQSLFSREEILGWLKSLEYGSGGKKRWRMLSFNVGHKRAFGDWVKYIRLCRTEYNGQKCYFAYTTRADEYFPLRRDVHMQENIKINHDD